VRRRFQDVRGNRKILAQHRQSTAARAGFQVRQAALKEALVGEHRKRRRAAAW
jgi:hypothetical protein